MKVIKEYTGDHVVIRTNCYGSRLSFLMDLFNIAKKDFPSLELGHVEVKHYGGRHYAGTFGLEFELVTVGSPMIPIDYEQITCLEMTR